MNSRRFRGDSSRTARERASATRDATCRSAAASLRVASLCAGPFSFPGAVPTRDPEAADAAVGTAREGVGTGARPPVDMLLGTAGGTEAVCPNVACKCMTSIRVSRKLAQSRWRSASCCEIP